MTAVEGSNNSPSRRLFVTSIQACLKERVSELKDSPKDKPTRRKSEKSESVVNESVEQLTNDTDHGIGKYFSKSFEFKVLSDKKPPKTSAFFVEEKWKVKELLDLKLRLNEVKGKLDNFNLSEWHFHTKCVNKAAEVQKYLRKHIEPELLTQAWCKFYEIVASTCLIPKKAVDDRRLNSVHLCEAPGAFVTSLNHFLQLKHPLIQWDWMATTLNPYHEQNTHSCMINDDRLIYNTLEKWNFGVDCTGNLFNPLNMKYIVDKAKEKFSEGVLLVTADGSFDCQLTPGEQETMVAPLLYCEVITAIQILKPGGSLLLKMFTMFECETICLMYLLYLLFGKVQVFKPATSKEGNSEVYIVCLYFNPSYNFEKILAVLISNYGFDITKNAAMLGQKKIPDEFMNQLKECAKLFEKHQETVIKSNIKLFQNMCDNERTELKNLQENIAQEYVRRYNLERIKFGHVVGFQSLKDVPVLNMDARFEEGSFNDRLNKPQLDMNLKLEILKKSVSRVDTHWPFQKDTVWMRFSGIPVISDINTGSPVAIVNNSKFCSGHLLKVYNEIIKLFGNFCTKSEEKSSHPAVKMCDVSNKPWSLNMWVAQRECMKLITERLMDMEENTSFILTGLPLLTQFNVGLVYIIGHAFEEVGFANPRKSGYSLFFKGLKKDCLVQINDNCLEHIRKANSSYKESVLSFVNIQELCVDRRFYKTIIATNHICLKNFIDERISESLTI